MRNLRKRPAISKADVSIFCALYWEEIITKVLHLVVHTTSLLLFLPEATQQILRKLFVWVCFPTFRVHQWKGKGWGGQLTEINILNIRGQYGGTGGVR